MTACCPRAVYVTILTYQGKRASELMKQQAAHYDTTYHLIDAIIGVQRKRHEYEMLIRGLVLETQADTMRTARKHKRG